MRSTGEEHIRTICNFRGRNHRRWPTSDETNGILVRPCLLTRAYQRGRRRLRPVLCMLRSPGQFGPGANALAGKQRSIALDIKLAVLGHGPIYT
jgi:hypothetical protein